MFTPEPCGNYQIKPIGICRSKVIGRVEKTLPMLNAEMKKIKYIIMTGLLPLISVTTMMTASDVNESYDSECEMKFKIKNYAPFPIDIQVYDYSYEWHKDSPGFTSKSGKDVGYCTLNGESKLNLNINPYQTAEVKVKSYANITNVWSFQTFRIGVLDAVNVALSAYGGTQYVSFGAQSHWNKLYEKKLCADSIMIDYSKGDYVNLWALSIMNTEDTKAEMSGKGTKNAGTPNMTLEIIGGINQFEYRPNVY